MANPEHVKILRRGVESWNAWRGSNPNIRPDLRGENIGGAHLVYKRYWPADLAKSAHKEPILHKPILDGINLRRAQIEGTYFGQAELKGANLRGAEGEGADFREAKLNNVNFSSAGLRKAKLQKAVLDSAILAGTDLRFSPLDNADLQLAGQYNPDRYQVSTVDT